ncbi:MAG: SulP family inorganic anion transporter [Gammaproteobacteria bacterium]|nr:SulP family inorganic anion transporter [Gammaproteobacteria bacterium]
MLRSLFPFLRWRSRIDRESFQHDLIAGLTGAIVVLPQGVAFATIAGMPPEYGLYAGIVPAIVAALFGSSWHLVSGPTTAASVVLFSTLSPYALPGSEEYVQLALTLTLMVGIFQLVLGMLRLGAVVDFISHTVVVGFISGAAILIMLSQVQHFLGLDISGGGHLYQILVRLAQNIGKINPYDLTVGLTALLAGIASLRWFPRIPYMLVSMIAGGILAYLLNLILGQGSTGIETVGALPAGLPPLSRPGISFEVIQKLAPAAAAITLLALTEAVTIGRSLALRSGQNLDSNQEFVGQGLSNVAAGFFSGYVATGSFNRSAVNYEAGARTPLAAVFAGLFLMVCVVLVAPLTAYLPNAVMASVLFLVAWKLIDVPRIARIIRASRMEAVVLVLTISTALFVGLEFAILLGVVFGLLLYVMDTSRPRMFSRVPDVNQPDRGFVTDPNLDECPQLKILRVDGSLYFGSTHYVERMLRIYRQREPRQTHLLLICSGVNEIDVSGAEFLALEAQRRTAEGGGLYLYRIKADALVILRRGSYMQDIGEDHQFQKKHHAIATIFPKLNHSFCKICERRIFRECATIPGPEDKD